jgi:hypothetical protein
MRSAARSCIFIFLVLVAACGSAGATTATTSSAPNARALAALASTGAVMTPTFAVRVSPRLDWTAPIADAREIMRWFDSDVAAALAERGLQHGWVLASDLAASYKRNPTYAADPYALAEEPLRAAGFTAGTRLPEPLASQLRTMIALHEGARMVLLPVELSFEPAENAPKAARGSLKIVLVDPRFSEVLWVGAVRSGAANADPRPVTADLAKRVVDLIVSR